MYFYKKAMKYLLSLFLYLSVFTLCAQQGATMPKPYFSLNDSTFYVGQKLVIQGTMFNICKDEILYDHYPKLDSIAAFLVIHTKLKVEVGYHTDSRTKPSTYAQDYGAMRTAAIVNYLIKKGVPQERLTGKNYGKTRLMNKCKDGVKCTEDEHAVNRRVEFTITAIE